MFHSERVEFGNSLPEGMVEAETLTAFKKCLKRRIQAKSQ